MSDNSKAPEQLLQFPCKFPIKVMGRDTDGFRDHVVSLVEQHTDTVDPSAVRVAPSRKGNFISLTITIDARSQQQLDEIYQALTSDDDVLISL